MTYFRKDVTTAISFLGTPAWIATKVLFNDRISKEHEHGYRRVPRNLRLQSVSYSYTNNQGVPDLLA